MFILAVVAGLVSSIDLNSSDTQQRAAKAETQARAVETFALSSVAGSVPGREAVRKAQAVAIMEARRMGLDISIAAIGSGGTHGGDSAADEQAFARLVQRFPDTLKAAEEGDALRQRLSKTWKSGSAFGEDPSGLRAPHSRAGASPVAASFGVRPLLEMGRA